jgi:transcriptional regulator with XRE-family HTH domain/Zn-dependent peptidase ImmA (M78 family)
MIRNERQYRITRAQAAHFVSALQSLEGEAERSEVHPTLLRAQRDALQSQLDDLECDLREYEALRRGEFEFEQLGAIMNLPRLLISARIARGLTQKGLAQRLGLKEQQIQRYEATEYTSASLARIREVVDALGLGVDESAIEQLEGVSLRDVLRKLSDAGLPSEFVYRRLLPRQAMPFNQADNDVGDGGMPAHAVIETIRRIFNWSAQQLLGDETLALQNASGGARFKVTAGANLQRVSAYTVYAHFLSLISIQASSNVSVKPVPTDPAEIVSAVKSTYGHVDLTTITKYAWDLGVPVLALDDPGAFHGACFREGGRNVIVLKQKTQSNARWVFDLLHELWHAGQEPEFSERTVIESDEMSIERRQSREEVLAGHFAAAVLLEGRGQELAEQCLTSASSDLRRLKAAVQRTAEREGVAADILANYLAFRLATEQNQNWWGAATNLQSIGDPWVAVRDVFFERADLTTLAEPDRELLAQAITRWEDSSHE